MVLHKNLLRGYLLKASLVFQESKVKNSRVTAERPVEQSELLAYL